VNGFRVASHPRTNILAAKGRKNLPGFQTGTIFQAEVDTMRHGLSLRGMIEHAGVLLGMAAILFAATRACAGELEPRSYANTPVGLNFLIGSYAYSEGGLSTNASLPIKDAQLRIHTEVLAYARTLDVWGKSGKFDVMLPYSQACGAHWTGLTITAGVRR
jgi:hypothetical protein